MYDKQFAWLGMNAQEEYAKNPNFHVCSMDNSKSKRIKAGGIESKSVHVGVCSTDKSESKSVHEMNPNLHV